MKKLKRIEDYDKNLPIVEIYTAVQSEGSRAGYPTVVIRTTGCTHRCFFGEGGWCDSWYTSIHPEKGHFNNVIKGKCTFFWVNTCIPTITPSSFSKETSMSTTSCSNSNCWPTKPTAFRLYAPIYF